MNSTSKAGIQPTGAPSNLSRESSEYTRTIWNTICGGYPATAWMKPPAKEVKEPKSTATKIAKMQTEAA